MDLLSHKTCRVQIYTGKTVQTALLAEVLFILFTLHLFTKRCINTEAAKVAWIMDYTTITCDWLSWRTPTPQHVSPVFIRVETFLLGLNWAQKRTNNFFTRLVKKWV